VEIVAARSKDYVEKNGTLEGWKSGAYQAAQYHHFGLAICMSFVGVLIDLLKLDTIIIMLTGESSHGKSTSQKLGASSWGDVRLGKGLFVSCAATGNAIEAQFELASGTYSAHDDATLISAEQLRTMIAASVNGSAAMAGGPHATGGQFLPPGRRCGSTSPVVDVGELRDRLSRAATAGKKPWSCCLLGPASLVEHDLGHVVQIAPPVAVNYLECRPEVTHFLVVRQDVHPHRVGIAGDLHQLATGRRSGCAYHPLLSGHHERQRQGWNDKRRKRNSPRKVRCHRYSQDSKRRQDDYRGYQ